MMADEALDYLRDKYNMVDKTINGVRYLRFAEGFQWVVSTGMNQFMVNMRDDYAWSWYEDRDEDDNLENIDLIWEMVTFSPTLGLPAFMDGKMDILYEKHKQLEKEIKEKKYQMKLIRLNSDF